LPMESVQSDGTEFLVSSFLVAWERQREALIFQVVRESPSSKPDARSLWRYDFNDRTITRIRDNAGAASRRILTRPEGDLLAIKYPMDTFDPPTKLALLNLSTLEETEIADGGPSVYFAMQWDPDGERLSLERLPSSLRRSESGGQEPHVLAIYSVSERKTIAERIISQGERKAEVLWTSWMPDGRSLVVLEEGRRSLSILGPDLQETGRIDLPARIKQPWDPTVVGNQILIADGKTDSLWRFDLAAKRWKRIY
jgi:dipeptidyl aminopeptidase/acylaminoacyl peptidase